MAKEKITLNPSQKRVVEFIAGPLLVVAGAGTGKTRIIAQRIKHLIKKKKIVPEEILALTFTEKSSEEMLNRVDDVMPLGYEEPWIDTFHSFADRLLRKEGLGVGLDSSYKIISSAEQWILLRENLFKLGLEYYKPLGNPTKFISAILKFISRLQDENISSAEFAQFVSKYDVNKEERKRWKELASVYKKYNQLKIDNSKFDFGDLIMHSIRLFKDRPEILKNYQNQFKHVLVDEFQDTNYAQYELVKLLCPKGKLKKRSLLVVGDDSQSIYKFRGAAVSNILEFQKDYPDAKMETVLESYRSTQSILDPAYKLIKNNDPDTLEAKLGISKKLVSKVSKKGTKPLAAYLETAENEVEFVVRKVLDILAKESDYTYKDFAILARANNHLTPFVYALRKYGLPYQLVGNRGLYDREEVRDVLALLRAVIDENNGGALYKAMSIGSSGISSQETLRMLSKARKERKQFWKIVSESADSAVREFCKLILEFKDLVPKLCPSEFIYEFVTKFNYVGLFLENETVENQLCIKNLDLFLNKAKKFENEYRNETNRTPTVIDFVDYIDFLIEAGDNPAQAELQDVDTVNLMTVHSSKGLEFPVVFMVNLISGRFPTRNRKDVIGLPDEIIKEALPSGDPHIQEERRLFYVGMTRAGKYLFLTLAKDYGGKRKSIPSGYIKETGIKIGEISLDISEIAKDQVGLFGLESGYREPKAEKITDFTPRFLSYSQFNTYNTCPLRYKYSYVLNIPQPPNHALSFGSTIHNTLKDFHNRLLFEDVSVDRLLEVYKKNWQPSGYIDARHSEERFKSGEEMLKRYYKDNAKKKPKVIGLEKAFNIKIGGVKFFGLIDRIDEIKGGVEIIDYKTGSPKDQKFVDKDDQVTFYAMGVEEGLGYNPKKLSLYFVESGEKLSTSRTKMQFEEKKKEAVLVVKNIKGGKFDASSGMHCSWCSFKNICPFVHKK